MSSFDINIVVDDKDVLGAIEKTLGAVSPISLEAFLREEAVLWLQDRAQDRFSSEGDDASGKWKPLSWSTNNQRIALGFPPVTPINVRTGILENWLIHNEGQYRPTVSGASMSWPGPVTDGELGTKFAAAQKGKSSPPTPARPVVAANEFDLEMLLNGVVQWVTDLAGLELA